MNQELEQFFTTFDQLHSRLKWNVPNKQVLMAVASSYAVSDKPFNLEQFIRIADLIKKRATLFSTMRSYSRFTAAAMLDIHFTEPEEKIENMFNLYDQLIRTSFGRGPYTYIAALTVLINSDDDQQEQTIIKKAQDMYEHMKSEHRFLTSKEDYPMATLLATVSEHEKSIQKSGYFYSNLRKNGFTFGNNLQFLSHILAMSKDENEDVLLDRTIQVYDRFHQNGFSTKLAYYAVMGLLALLPEDQYDMDDIKDMYTTLKNRKHFRWQNDFNVMLAVHFHVKSQLTHGDIVNTSLYTTMETIVQAQQAAMTAAVVAASAASANSGGGN
ncbi:DUF4003 family protein [Lentibacillus saliphilus]|uniref:DUF4003 family protein n=1 Tax=Lentibacillus saliphilus TaxID=2737028 RepID=UPI001C306C03|nr:DUF4003 family protein [Lentibacillus saliphilus]